MNEIRSYSKLEAITFEISKFDIMGMLIKADKVPPNFRLEHIEWDDDNKMLTLRVERHTQVPAESESDE